MNLHLSEVTPGEERRTNTGKFTERSAGFQWAALVAIITILIGGLGAVVLWAADARIDQKYATDVDLYTVQSEMAAQVRLITESVNENTRTVRATTRSVDGLTLVVLDLRIRDLDDELIDLALEKQINLGSWSTRDDRSMRDREKTLTDLHVQRNRLFKRILEVVP